MQSHIQGIPPQIFLGGKCAFRNENIPVSQTKLEPIAWMLLSSYIFMRFYAKEGRRGVLALDTSRYVARRICSPLPWTCKGDPSRAAIAEKLQHTPGKHLIMVRYDKDSDNHNIHDEWVYNGAEIDTPKSSGPANSIPSRMASSSPTSKTAQSGW